MTSAHTATGGAPREVRFEGVSKDYDGVTVVDDFNLEVQPGEFLTILGPSGSGKTTVLNMLAGFTRATRGSLLIGDRDVTGLPPEARNLGMVFQNFALFPHLSVCTNVEFPLKMRGVSARERRAMALDALERVQLTAFAERKPSQLSGGQKQRVGIARAIVFHPPVLLMDESLSALDLKLREQLQVEIKRLHRETGSTVLFVTHDQGEAMAMSDRVAVMTAGKLVQVGTPRQVHDKPATRFVAKFIGKTNIFSVTQGRIDGATHGVLPQPLSAAAEISVRPTAIRKLPPRALAAVTFEANVSDRAFTGHFYEYLLIGPAGQEWLMQEPATSDSGLAPGMTCRFGFDLQDAFPLSSD